MTSGIREAMNDGVMVVNGLRKRLGGAGKTMLSNTVTGGLKPNAPLP